ncbi:TadE/TadG family type IV pilus assembly protein [uncultured Methylobacterium sp.]|uniref:TadE/TadG family type IV pilus assembly protein n=1 Tax=uncultured Methylobacterium sp. TaxID=157278 RepID=UPI0035C9CE97
MSGGCTIECVVRCRHRVEGFLADSRGASAVEFALVCLPFLSVFGAIIQIGLVSWAGQNLDNSLQTAVRKLYVGSFQSSNQGGSSATNLASLKAQVCGSGGNVFSCQDLKLDVTLASSFAAGTAPDPFDAATKDWSAGFGSHYACAKPGDIVVVTAAVKYPLFFSFLNFGAASFADGSLLVQSSSVFRTEPYQSSGAC